MAKNRNNDEHVPWVYINVQVPHYEHISQACIQTTRKELQLIHEALLWNDLMLASYLLPYYWTNELRY